VTAIASGNASLAFVKVEGLGNDFVIVDARGADLEAVTASLRPAAPLLCDRRRGVGADGVLVMGDGPEGTDAAMRILNADGSRPEMCGNGLRCAALWLSRDHGQARVRVDTDAGLRVCTVEHDLVDVDMGPATVGAAVTLNGRTWVRVSVGNPHAISWVDADEDPEALARAIGPVVERDPAFPEGTNVELAKIEGDAITLWVWERGCGITHACGTGATATVAAAVGAGRLPAEVPVRVQLPGGPLWITAPADPAASLRMRGPARIVFEGRWTAV
jgi:diaminopimelate epimerase